MTPPPAKNIFMITLILFILFVGTSIWMIDQRVRPVLMEIAEVQLDSFASRAINTAMQFVEDYEFDEVNQVTYDDEGNVVTYNWNPSVVSEINRVATDRVEEFFLNVNRGEPLEFENPLEDPPPDWGDGAEDRAEQDPTLVEIPLGQVTGNTVLANLGPKVPVNFEYVGNVRTNVKRETEEFGINSSWVSLYVDVEVDVQIVIPFMTKTTTVQTEIYIDGGAIMGDVPEFYGESDDNPSISVPKEDLQGE